MIGTSQWNRLPLTGRLVAGFVAAMLVVLTAAGVFVYWRVKVSLDDELNSELAATSQRLVGHVGSTGRPGDQSALLSGERYQVLDASGQVLSQSLGPQRSLLDESDVRRALAGPIVRDVGELLPENDQALRVYAVPLHPSQAGDPAVLVVTMSRNQRDEALRNLLVQLLIAGFATLVVTALVGERLAKASLVPVERYRRQAIDVTEGATGVRLDVPAGRDDEITRLGHSLNTMLEALEDALERERRFVDDASHELRTPLTVMGTRVQLARRRPRTVEQHEQILDEITLDLERLTELADQLLELRSPLTSGTDEAVDLATVVEDHCRQRADSVDIDFVITAETTTVSAPRTAIDRMVGNLLDNAVRHGRGPVRVRLRNEAQFAVLEVVDSGAGMDPATLATAPERFFRAPEARGRQGSGLGLALVQTVALAAHGELRLCFNGAHQPFGHPTPVSCAHDGSMTATLIIPTTPLAQSAPAGHWSADVSRITLST